MTSAESIDKNSGPQVARPSRVPRPLLRVLDFFSSLKLTVVFLCLGLLLVFIGTLAQVDEGLYNAQNRYFRSLLIWWGPAGAGWKLPVFPGGYLVGGILLLNLFAAHARRFKFSRKKIGIFMIHAGIVLLLLGQFATDLLSKESQMQIIEGETKNYSEDSRASELAIVDISDPKEDRVYALSESILAKAGEIRDPRLPFMVRVKNFWPNASVFEKPGLPENMPAGAIKPAVTEGLLRDDYLLPRPEVTDMDSRNMPAALVEIVGDKGTSGTFLVYAGILARQPFIVGGKQYELALRFARSYYPFNITLLKATHEKYKGTEIPKNFASRIRVDHPGRNEARETMIYMNNPLRFSGLTFFQYQMGADEMRMRPGDKRYTVLQVVRNPSWLTPYLSCVLVGLGLVVQFMAHLIGFVRKRRTA
jgi:hypothetical protein